MSSPFNNTSIQNTNGIIYRGLPRRISHHDLDKLRNGLVANAHMILNDRSYFGNRHYQTMKHCCNIFEGLARRYQFQPSITRIDMQNGDII